MSGLFVLIVWGVLQGNPTAEAIGLYQNRASCEKALAEAVEILKHVPKAGGACINTGSKYL